MYPLFNCDNININKELCVVFSASNLDCDINAYYEIDGRTYRANLILFESDVLFRIVCKKWRQVEAFLFSSYSSPKVDVLAVRKQVVDLLLLCRFHMKATPKGKLWEELRNNLKEHLHLFKNVISCWSEFDDKALVKLTSSCMKDRELPIHHYFHMYLEVHWLFLSLYYICEIPVEDLRSEIFKSLITLLNTLFTRSNGNEELSSRVCLCVDEIWMLLQLFSDKLNRSGLLSTSFWELFNDLLKENDELFSFWLLHQIAKTYNLANSYSNSIGFDLMVNENDLFLDRKLKSLNSKLSPNSENNYVLFKALNLIFALLNDCWTGNMKVEPYQILWEIFNKHLNLLSSNVKLSAIKMVELVENIVNKKSNENSYELFLYMLNKFLVMFPNQWNRMRGRIYCKLPPHKMNEFTDVGLFNVSLLFFTLSKSVGLEEVSDKFLSLLSNLTAERQSTSLVINIYCSLAILHVVRNRTIREICGPILKVVEEASENRDRYHTVRTFIEGFDGILSASQNFYLNQHALIGKWATKYFKFCQIHDLCCFLDILIYNVKRIRNSGTWLEWKHTLKEFISPNLKTIATSHNAPVQVGELAALVDTNLSSENVIIFTSDIITPRVVCQFLLTILEDVTPNYVLTKNHETAILHSWIRCSLLNCDNIDSLTKNVMKISALYGIFNENLIDINKPIFAFIKCLGKINSNQRLLSTNLNELCEQCFGGVDSWVVPYIKSPTSASVMIHVYTCVSLLVFHCSNLLYHKNRSNCLLNRLISTFLLPTSILLGNSPHSYILNAVQCTWHVFIQGIHSLISSNDAYLERTIRDMITRYLPLLSLEDSPIVKAIDSDNLSKIILERICSSFLLQISKNSDDNVFKALKVVQVITEKENQVEKQRIIVECTIIGIYEVIMFRTNKNLAIDILKFIRSRYCVDEEIYTCLKSSILKITEKHLAFYANSYFQFANLLVQIIPTEMRLLLPLIREKVTDVEKMRGVGYDNTLRQGIDRLDILLLQT